MENEVNYEALYNESQEKINNLEWLIVKHKQEAKVEPEVKNEWVGISQEDVKRLLDEEKFYSNNPGLSEYREELNKYTSKGLSYDQAKTLLEQDDPAIINKTKTNSLGVTAWVNTSENVYSDVALAEMTQEQYNKAMNDIESWSAKLIMN